MNNGKVHFVRESRHFDFTVLIMLLIFSISNLEGGATDVDDAPAC